MVDLSIIIPAYNCESTIGRCLDNIIDERYSDKYEISKFVRIIKINILILFLPIKKMVE